MTNYVNYQVELTPANASLINQLNKLIITGDDAPAETPKSTPSQGKSSTAVDDQNTPDSGTTLADFKTAAKASKKDHGEEFTMAVLTEAGVDVATTLGRTMSKVEQDQYDDIITIWQAGPVTTAASDEPEDDLEDDLEDDDDLGDDVPSIDAVKTALKAYAKETGRDEAKELMAKYGVKALSGVDKLDDDKLTKLFAELV